ncbi:MULTISPECIES: hypothetical protein [unclassified Streptomyces]|uniref:hypothetical protein n=1 Tax=unclassified Streptomyces TaxID=2593676 RepID=UPI003D8B0C05
MANLGLPDISSRAYGRDTLVQAGSEEQPGARIDGVAAKRALPGKARRGTFVVQDVAELLEESP